MSVTAVSVAVSRAPLSTGVTMSQRPIVMPPRVANWKPTVLMPSTSSAVSSGPRIR